MDALAVGPFGRRYRRGYRRIGRHHTGAQTASRDGLPRLPGILSLEKTYSKPRLEAASQRAVQLQAFSYQSLEVDSETLAGSSTGVRSRVVVSVVRPSVDTVSVAIGELHDLFVIERAERWLFGRDHGGSAINPHSHPRANASAQGESPSRISISARSVLFVTRCAGPRMSIIAS